MYIMYVVYIIMCSSTALKTERTIDNSLGVLHQDLAVFVELWSAVGKDTESREIVTLIYEAIHHRKTTGYEMISTVRRRGRRGRERERGNICHLFTQTA